MINLKKYSKEVKTVFCFLFFGLQIVFSQNIPEYKSFKGEVVNDSLNLSGIHIINKNSGAKSITDEKGFFSIGVKKNDTIIISSVQIKPHVIVINFKVYEQDLVKVYVEPFINQLENVDVKPHNLSGNMLNDMLDSGVKNPLNFNDVGIPGYEGKREEIIVSETTLLLQTLLLPISGGLDIEAVYKHLSGYYKELKKIRLLDKQYVAIVNIMEFYGLIFFINNFNLEEEEVYEFVLGALENTNIEEDFRTLDHSLVLKSFENYYKTIIDEKN